MRGSCFVKKNSLLYSVFGLRLARNKYVPGNHNCQMDILIGQGSAILSNILSIKTINADMFHSLAGLTGALAVMLNFVERRVTEENALEDVMVAQITGTLSAIEAKLDDFHAMYSKKFCGIPYAKLWVIGAPLFGMGSKRILTQLKRLEADLSGDITLLDLQIQSNQAMALYEISGGHFLKQFREPDLKRFWTSNFGNDQRVPVPEFVKALTYEVSDTFYMNRDMSRLCEYAAGTISARDTIDALAFNGAVQDKRLDEWVSDIEGLVTVLVNAHSAEVTCMAQHRGHLVTASSDKTAKVFHLQPDSTPLLKTVLIGHTAVINDVSCENGYIATASDDSTVRVWNVMDGTLLKTIAHDAPVKAVFFAGHDTLVTATNTSTQNITVHDIKEDRVVTKLYGHVGGTTGISIVGSTVFTTGKDRAIKSWDISTGVQKQEIPHAHDKGIECVTADKLVATYAGNVLKVWSQNHNMDIVEYCQLSIGLKSYAKVHDMQIMDGKLYVIISDYVMSGRHTNNRLVVAEVKSAKVLHTLFLDTGNAKVHPTSLCVIEGGLYVGFSDGSMSWYTNLKYHGSSNMCRGIPTNFKDSLSPEKPLLAGGPHAMVAGKKGSKFLTVVPHNAKVVLPAPATFLYDSSECFYVGSHNAVYKVSYDGNINETIAVDGTVGSLFIYKETLYVQVFSPETRYAKYRKNKVLKFSSDRVASTVAQDVYSLDANICAFGNKLVYPGVNDGELGVFDMDEDASLPPIRYDDYATVTAIRSFGDDLWTVHGSLDVVVWKYMADGYIAQTQTMAMKTELSDLMVTETSVVAAMTDGTVAIHNKGELSTKTVKADHKSGPIALCGNASLGTELRVSYLLDQV